ncbi:MAG: hypothetical protein A2138_04435 [Deltaproteobacteria bacterium RBG_16_71_12]|nr:MAG: hypothetical protein A2138_04435 [Deltaproteobacteria bacterium RBG_16_71_12]
MMLATFAFAVGLAAIGPHPIFAPPLAPPPPAPPAPAARCAEPTGAQVRVMVMDLAVDPRFASQRGALGQIVAEEAARVRGYQILSAEEVRTVLTQEANKQLMGCDDSSCLAELAAALDAALVISGRVDASSDGTAVVALSVLNTHALVVLNRVTFSWGGADDQLPNVVRTAAQTLVLAPSERPPGAVRVLGVAGSAQVFVDGVASLASEAFGGLSIGPHEVTVTDQGKVPVTVWAVVTSGAVTDVEVVLEDQPTSAAWLWLGGAAAVIGGGALALGAALVLGKGTVDAEAAVEPWGINDVEKLATGAR